MGYIVSARLARPTEQDSVAKLTTILKVGESFLDTSMVCAAERDTVNN